MQCPTEHVHIILEYGKSTQKSIYSPEHSEVEEINEEHFKRWLRKKEVLNKNIEKVCRKYGKSLRNVRFLGAGIIHDEEHNLLFSRNNKVINSAYWYIYVCGYHGEL